METLVYELTRSFEVNDTHKVGVLCTRIISFNWLIPLLGLLQSAEEGENKAHAVKILGMMVLYVDESLRGVGWTLDEDLTASRGDKWFRNSKTGALSTNPRLPVPEGEGEMTWCFDLLQSVSMLCSPGSNGDDDFIWPVTVEHHYPLLPTVISQMRSYFMEPESIPTAATDASDDDQTHCYAILRVLKFSEDEDSAIESASATGSNRRHRGHRESQNRNDQDNSSYATMRQLVHGVWKGPNNTADMEIEMKEKESDTAGPDTADKKANEHRQRQQMQCMALETWHETTLAALLLETITKFATATRNRSSTHCYNSLVPPPPPPPPPPSTAIPAVCEVLLLGASCAAVAVFVISHVLAINKKLRDEAAVTASATTSTPPAVPPIGLLSVQFTLIEDDSYLRTFTQSVLEQSLSDCGVLCNTDCCSIAVVSSSTINGSIQANILSTTGKTLNSPDYLLNKVKFACTVIGSGIRKANTKDLLKTIWTTSSPLETVLLCTRSLSAGGALERRGQQQEKEAELLPFCCGDTAMEAAAVVPSHRLYRLYECTLVNNSSASANANYSTVPSSSASSSSSSSFSEMCIYTLRPSATSAKINVGWWQSVADMLTELQQDQQGQDQPNHHYHRTHVTASATSIDPNNTFKEHRINSSNNSEKGYKPKCSSSVSLLSMDVLAAQRTQAVHIPDAISTHEAQALHALAGRRSALRASVPTPMPATTAHTATVKEPEAIPSIHVAQPLSLTSATSYEANVHRIGREIRSKGNHLWEVLFLHTDAALFTMCPEFIEKVTKTVVKVDLDQNWGLLSAGPFCVRVAEYHSQFAPSKAIPDTHHYDQDSLVTLDIMLSDPNKDFLGAEIQTLEIANRGGGGGGGGGIEAQREPENDGCRNSGGTEKLVSHTLSQFDALCFVSHKYHCVRPLLWGKRVVMVLEFWRGSQQHRTCPHRCLAVNKPCSLENEEPLLSRIEGDKRILNPLQTTSLPVVSLPFTLAAVATSEQPTNNSIDERAREVSPLQWENIGLFWQATDASASVDDRKPVFVVPFDESAATKQLDDMFGADDSDSDSDTDDERVK